MEIIRVREYDEDLILPLYEACGWSNYTERPSMLRNAWKHSLVSYGAWDDDELVGLIRCVGDGFSIVYIQDLLVKPGYQRMGIGTRLVETVCDEYPDVYQTVLLTDETPASVSFYEALGFTRTSDSGCASFIRIVTDEPSAG